MPEQACSDEFRYTMAAYKTGAKVPQPIEIIHADGRIGAVYKKIHGKTMLSLMLKNMRKTNYYANCLADCHIDIHNRLTIEDDIPTVKDKLRFDIEAEDDLSRDEKQSIYQHLLNLPDGNSLCHFDFHPDNILLSDNDYCVLDWMTACKGDPLSDVARTGIILKFAVIPRASAVVNMIAGAFQKSVYKKYIRRYLCITGAKPESVEQWELVVAAARLREWIPEQEKKTLLKFIRQRLSVYRQTT
jgi:thiamine kinase-like enzyme